MDFVLKHPLSLQFDEGVPIHSNVLRIIQLWAGHQVSVYVLFRIEENYSVHVSNYAIKLKCTFFSVKVLMLSHKRGVLIAFMRLNSESNL